MRRHTKTAYVTYTALSSPLALLRGFEPNKLCGAMFQQTQFGRRLTHSSSASHARQMEMWISTKISSLRLFRHLHQISAEEAETKCARRSVYTFVQHTNHTEKPRNLIRPKFHNKTITFTFFGGNGFQHHEGIRHMRHHSKRAHFCVFFS